MYIRKVEITNLKSIASFSMEFPEGKEAGWHVLIGDNGAGKSTIVRGIAAVLVGPDEIGQVRPYWEEWLSHGAAEGKINLQLQRDGDLDQTGPTPPPTRTPIENEYRFLRDKITGKVTLVSNANASKMKPTNFNWGPYSGWFSVAYGPFRRFTGGDPGLGRIYSSAPKAGAHLSVFGEDVALTEALEWLKELDRKRLKERERDSNVESEAGNVLQGITRFINAGDLLPHGAKFLGINIDGNPEFVDANGSTVGITQLSDGYRSILSLVFELLRQLIRVYEAKRVFPDGGGPITEFDLPGVVLVDEIDAHLHPTWQTRIGQWFTRVFPRLQFIVTTHSPLICRACSKGSIWRLAAPGSGLPSGEVTGNDKNELIYGDVLDAYDTEVFGPGLTRGLEGIALQAEYRKLKYKKIYDVPMSADEQARFENLKSIFHGHAETSD